MNSPKRRKLVIAAGASLATLLLVTFVSFDAVDYRPYFRQEYYRQTTERLRAIAETNRSSTGDLLAGFGRARLTPELNSPVEQANEGRFREVPLAGYGNRKGKPASGVNDDVFVKAVALRAGPLTGIIFASDALIVPREVADMAAQQLYDAFGLERAQLYFSATHTHCSLGGWGEGFVGEAFAGKFNPGTRAWFADRFAAAAREALADLKPAEFGHGSFQEPALVRNRLVGKLGTVDSEFCFLVVKQKEGQTGVVGSYAAHATVLSGRVMDFSGDYPGYWQREVERATGGHALFVAGPVGSHGPVAGEDGFKGAERMGTLLASTLLERMKKVPLTNRISFQLGGLDVALPEMNVRLLDNIRLRPWVSGKLLSVPASGSYLQAFRMNDVIWISTPCDFSGELALETKNFLKAHGFSSQITSFNGDYIGYVIRSCYYHLDGYEPRVMSFYGPYMPDYLDELIRGLALGVGGQPQNNP